MENQSNHRYFSQLEQTTRNFNDLDSTGGSNPCLSARIESMSYVSLSGNRGNVSTPSEFPPPTHPDSPPARTGQQPQTPEPDKGGIHKLSVAAQRRAAAVRLALRNRGSRYRRLFLPGILSGNSSSMRWRARRIIPILASGPARPSAALPRFTDERRLEMRLLPGGALGLGGGHKGIQGGNLGRGGLYIGRPGPH